MARLLFFGKLGDMAGGRERLLTLGRQLTVSALKARLATEDPALGEALAAPSVRVIINQTFGTDAHALTDDDEIAFLPPVSGG